MDRTMLNRSPAELIAMATGRRGAAAHADAHRLVEKLGLKKLADAGAAEIREVCRGMTPEAVQRLMAGVEIGLRIAELKTEYEALHFKKKKKKAVTIKPSPWCLCY